MDAGSVADWIAASANVATAGVAAFAAYYGVRTFQHQRTANDIQLALNIFQSINRYWDRMIDTKSANYDYDMGQILAQFETAATLFNRQVLTRDALPILKDHIVEVFGSLVANSDGEKLINASCSSPDTFKELKAFLKEHTSTALNALSFREKFLEAEKAGNSA
jgi:hypothetical protein